MNVASLLIFASPLVLLFFSFSSNKLARHIYICFTALLLFLILAFRHDLGYDYPTYIEIFNLSVECYYESVTCRILDISHFYDSYILFFAIYAFLTIACILFVTLSEKSPYILLNYTCLPWFYIESFGIIRQELSITFAVVMYYYFQKKNKTLQFFLFGALSLFTHFSSILFVLLLVFLKYFDKRLYIKKVAFLSVAFVSCLLFIFYDNLIELIPLLKFYNNGGHFGYSMYFLYVLLFIASYKGIHLKNANYILSLALFIYIGTLSVDSSLARIAIPFLIPLLWYKWDVVFNKIQLNKFKLYYAFIICISLFVLILNIKSTDPRSSLIPYKSFINTLWI